MVNTIVRIVVMVLALANMVLMAFGISPIDVDESSLAGVIASAVCVGSAIWTAWKNNSFTKSAITADTVKQAIDSDLIDMGEILELIETAKKK